MKRPPGLWILLSAGLLWLSLEEVDGVRATSLIFAKTSTTTSTTTPAPSSEAAGDEEGDTTEPVVDANSTKPNLTGLPQLDYVWDPNLPKELNGYNLSDYPFYERVPEDIDFKCDGLHDGFYASVKHKCQVYHHCLFGTRYDFLCANYTAFDQKTFICHFASEVDCANSKKFWHRNDALYQAASTTTPKPLVIHTTAPPAPQEPSAPGRRPYPRRPYRRRPQYDYYDDEYYDDYYEDRPRSNRGRKRPRPRPRPYYDDDYDDDYEYERRAVVGRRRVPQQGRRRYKGDRPKGDYEEEGEPDRRSSPRRKNVDKKREPDYSDEYEERKYNRRYHPDQKRTRKPPIETKEETRPIIKPVSGTIYDKPRIAPRIKLPVPKSEAEKYAYKPIAKPDREYDYPEESKERKPYRSRGTLAPKQPKTKPPEKKDYIYDSVEVGTNGTSVEDEYYDDYEEDEVKKAPTTTPKVVVVSTSTTTTTTTTTSTTTTTTPRPLPPIERLKEPLIRLVKRPFLPSRGGNPYAPRGLQPIGTRAQAEYHQVFRASAPQVPRNPLDLAQDEYDVTLNEALSPTLPNLPVRGYPSGFSPRDYDQPAASDSAPIYDYVYEPKVQRQRFAVPPVPERFQGQYGVIGEGYGQQGQQPRSNVGAQVYYRQF